MFDTIGERARWRDVYDRLASMEIGDLLTYEELTEITGTPLDQARSDFDRAKKELETNNSRTMANVRKTGYRMVEAVEHIDLARHHQKKARRQIVRAKRRAHSADRARLGHEDRARVDTMENNLALQETILRRTVKRLDAVEVETKREKRQRREAETMLEARIARLEKRAGLAVVEGVAS